MFTIKKDHTPLKWNSNCWIVCDKNPFPLNVNQMNLQFFSNSHPLIYSVFRKTRNEVYINSK